MVFPFQRLQCLSAESCVSTTTLLRRTNSVVYRDSVHDVVPLCQPSNNDQVYVSTPHQTQSTAYHGVVPLTSCFSNAGIAIQEEKGLKEMVVEKHVQRKPGSIEECIRTEDRGKIGPKTAKTGKRRSFGHSYDDESSDKTEASSSEGDFRSKYAAVEGAGRKRPKTRGCCTVNVTTTFVPHAVRTRHATTKAATMLFPLK